MHRGDNGERHPRHHHRDLQHAPPLITPRHDARKQRAASHPAHGHDRDQGTARTTVPEVREDGVQPRRDRVEHAHADEQQAAEQPHEPVAPQPAQGQRDGRIARVCHGRPDHGQHPQGSQDRRGRLDPQQQGQAAGIEQWPARENGTENAREQGHAADGDRGRPLTGREVTPGDLGDRVEHERLADRDHELAGDGPAVRRRAGQAHQPAGTGQGGAEAERPLEAGVEPAAGRQRQDDVHQREDPGQVTHRPLGHPHDPVGLCRDRRVGEPEELGARGQQRISGQDHPPVEPHRYHAPRSHCRSASGHAARVPGAIFVPAVPPRQRGTEGSAARDLLPWPTRLVMPRVWSRVDKRYAD